MLRVVGPKLIGIQWRHSPQGSFDVDEYGRCNLLGRR